MMNTKFQWFGFSIARKHVYFYVLLIATSLAANTMKESLLGGAVFDDQTREQLSHWSDQLRAAEQDLSSGP